jgi:hypothetical protein
MKVHYAPWAKVRLASSPAQHMGWLGLGWQPIAKKQGSLAVDASWRWSGRLRPAGGDGRWGTVLGHEGVARDTLEVGGGGGSAGAVTGGRQGCRSGR